ncbi:MAG: hypothetical protein JST58_16390 [Bacteroidetes bacterium]|nr:hypothetical protein [Bacteroidota bacterium]
MKIFNAPFSIYIFSTLLLIMFSFNEGFSQRFNHQNFGGNSGGRQPQAQPQPQQQFRQPQQQQAPQQNRQQVMMPQPNRRNDPSPYIPENRVTINGGSRNFGNHDFNRGNNNDNRQNIMPQNPVTPDNRDARQYRAIHDNQGDNQNLRNDRYGRDENYIYHRDQYRSYNDYSYHNYQPAYWGPRWHPIGYFLSALAADAIRLSIGNSNYYYSDGCYYSPYNDGYAVVQPPMGAVVGYLPDGYETVLVGNDYYYYFAGVFYIDNGQGYQMVAAPYGAIVSQLPAGAVEREINGEIVLEYNNTFFEPIMQDGQDAYQVVPVN